MRLIVGFLELFFRESSWIQPRPVIAPTWSHVAYLHMIPPRNWHASTVWGGGDYNKLPLRLVLPKCPEYPCSQCSPPGQSAICSDLTGGIPCYPPAVAANPVLSALCWALERAGMHPAEVGEGSRHCPDPLWGQVFQSSPVEHPHTSQRLDVPCLTNTERAVIATQACPPSILFSFSRVYTVCLGRTTLFFSLFIFYVSLACY